MAGGPAADTRERVQMPPMMAAHMLANMRDHLAALQEISEALSRDAFEEASRTAETRLGMSSLQAHGASHMAGFMPQGMRTLGTEMHKAASRLAVAAQNADVTGDLKPVLGALSEVTAACVACHAGYRVQ